MAKRAGTSGIFSCGVRNKNLKRDASRDIERWGRREGPANRGGWLSGAGYNFRCQRVLDTKREGKCTGRVNYFSLDYRVSVLRKGDINSLSRLIIQEIFWFGQSEKNGRLVIGELERIKNHRRLHCSKHIGSSYCRVR